MKDKGKPELCPHCGSRINNQQNALALPYRTILNKRFIVGRMLGRPGGFGITYLAWDLLLETTAAIKEFLPREVVSRSPGDTFITTNSKQDQATFKTGLQIFLQEAKTLARFSHPNIVRIRDCFTANNTAYLIMEYHRGDPLNQLIKKAGGHLSESRALEIMLPILDGLDAMHQQGCLHRDIKPQNIYLTEQGIPLLLDFGASRFALADNTQTLTVMLSTGYAPFEQYHKKGKQGPWSDIYACAATLYFMTTGKMPIDALERQHKDTLIPPIQYNPDLSAAFSLAIMQGLASAPQARPKQVQDFKQLLIRPRSLNIALNNVEKTAAIDCQRKNNNRPVEIRYIQEKHSFSLGRVVLIICLAVSLWFSWNTHQLLEKPFNPDPGFIDEIPPPMLYTEQGDFIEVEDYPTADKMNIAAQPEFIEQVVYHPQEARHYPPPPPAPIHAFPAIPEFALHACQNKTPHQPCLVNTAEIRHHGICLPTHEQALACVPPHGIHPPPPPPKHVHRHIPRK